MSGGSSSSGGGGSSSASRVHVVFQGEPGAYSEQAAFELLGKPDDTGAGGVGVGVETTGLPSFDDCFRALEEGTADLALLPIENSLGGSIHANYDLQLRHKLFIVAEHECRVRHCLLALPGVAKESIEQVLSHPQALAQCDGYLRRMCVPGKSSYDTAGSAKMIADKGMGTSAAIASALAAEYYGLDILDEGIEDDDNNFTRFLLLSRRWMPQLSPANRAPAWKTTMVFSLINKAGVLVNALQAFSSRDISLTKLESRPDKLQLKGLQPVVGGRAEHQRIPDEDRALLQRLGFPELEELEAAAGMAAAGMGTCSTASDPDADGHFQFVFYVDIVGSLADLNVQNALRNLCESASFLRILGCYPRDGALCHFVADAVRVPHGSVLRDLATLARRKTAGAAAGGGAAGGGAAGAKTALAAVRPPSPSPSRTPPLSKTPPPPPPPLRIGIVGFGNFGQFLARTMAKAHAVFASSRSDYSAVADELGVGYFRDAQSMLEQAALDVLILSVSILSFKAVVKALPAELLKGLLVVDVLSVKQLPKDALRLLLPPEADILCTHPMFGPESGKFSWRGLPFVYERVRLDGAAEGECESGSPESGSTESGSGAASTVEGGGAKGGAKGGAERCERFLEIFRSAGCRMVDMSCETHDEAAAGSQFVTHFTGRMLAELQLRSTPINTKGFETLLALVDNTNKDSLDLFRALYKCNPRASSQLDALKAAMATVVAQLADEIPAPVADETSAAEPGAADPGAADPGAAEVRLSAFVRSIRPSKTSETHALALELQRQGRDIVTTLTVGEPDFDPPQPVLDAIAEAAATGLTRYTPVGGWHSLKEAIAADYLRRKQVALDPGSQVLVTHGGKQAIFLAVLALCEAGDEVVVPAPYWVSYPEIVRLSGARPVVVQRRPEAGYVLSPDELAAALTPKTRMLILCNPCNPTGCTYSRAELEALAAVLRRPEHRGVMVLADEIYERLTYDGLEHVSFAALDGMAARTLIVNGFAKGFAMTGLRLGWLACAAPGGAVVAAALKLQSQLNSCPCSVSQHAGLAALTKVPEATLRPLYAELQRKRDVVVARLSAVPHVRCPTPKGAFYVFPDVSFYLGKKALTPGGRTVDSATDLCAYLIEEHGLALPPGDAFGAPSGVRFSYAAAVDQIEEALRRFAAGLAALNLA